MEKVNFDPEQRYNLTIGLRGQCTKLEVIPSAGYNISSGRQTRLTNKRTDGQTAHGNTSAELSYKKWMYM